MNHQDQHINNLLAKLANGSISKREKYQLQKYSLDYPFLADALEGYLDNSPSDHQSNLESIENSIKKSNQKKSKTIPIWIKYGPLGIAASLLFLIVVYKPWSNDKALSEIISEADNEVEMLEDVAYQETDVIEPSSTASARQTINKKVEGFDKEKKRSAPAKAKDSNSKVEFVENKTNQIDKTREEDEAVVSVEIATADLDYESSRAKIKSMKSGLKQIIGTVSDDTEQILVGAKILEPHSQQLISQTDIKGNFIIDIDTNIRTLEIAQTGYLSQLVDLSRIDNDTLAVKLLGNAHAVADGVRYGNMVPQAQSNHEEEIVSTDNETILYQPVIGFKAYDVYIKNSKSKAGIDLHGTLEVKFLILKGGVLGQFEILKSDFSDEEGIMVIEWMKNGPVWKAEYYPIEGKYQIEF